MEREGGTTPKSFKVELKAKVLEKRLTLSEEKMTMDSSEWNRREKWREGNVVGWRMFGKMPEEAEKGYEHGFLNTYYKSKALRIGNLTLGFSEVQSVENCL